MVAQRDLESMLELPRGRWSSLSILRPEASMRLLAFTPQPGRPRGFLLVLGGLSPVGQFSCSRVIELQDGGAEPVQTASSFLLSAEQASFVAFSYGLSGERPQAWPDGSPIEWASPELEERAWGEAGDLDAPGYCVLNSWLAEGFSCEPSDQGSGCEADAAPDDRGSLRAVCLNRSRPDQRLVERLAMSATWRILREMCGVSESRWLSLMTRFPMPCLGLLDLELDDLSALPAALASLPSLRALGLHGSSGPLPPLASSSLSELHLPPLPPGQLGAFLRGSSLPSLRKLIVHARSLSAPVDFSPLPAGAMVITELPEQAPAWLLQHARSARVLAVQPSGRRDPAELAQALASRGSDGVTLLGKWPGRDEALALCHNEGIAVRRG